MTESDASIKIVKLEKLQEKALKYIHNGKNLGVDVDDLCGMYHVQPLKVCWREHIYRVMYRRSKNNKNLELKRPTNNLPSNKRVQFKKCRRRKYELYLRSSLVRCVRIWEMLTESVQKATTKVKFKKLLGVICRTF